MKFRKQNQQVELLYFRKFYVARYCVAMCRNALPLNSLVESGKQELLAGKTGHAI